MPRGHSLTPNAVTVSSVGWLPLIGVEAHGFYRRASLTFTCDSISLALLLPSPAPVVFLVLLLSWVWVRGQAHPWEGTDHHADLSA